MAIDNLIHNSNLCREGNPVDSIGTNPTFMATTQPLLVTDFVVVVQPLLGATQATLVAASLDGHLPACCC